jgi:hypothetical protein
MKILTLMVLLLVGRSLCAMPNCVSMTLSSQESWSKPLNKPLDEIVLKSREFLLKMSFPKTCDAKPTRITEDKPTIPVTDPKYYIVTEIRVSQLPKEAHRSR